MNKKSAIICGMALLTILPVGVLACSKEAGAEMPPLERPPAPDIIEIGCGTTLAGLNKRIGVTRPTLTIETVDDLKLLEKVI